MSEGKPSEMQATEGRSPEEIRSDIEATRDQMGDMVEALAAKTDVKAQAKKSAEEAKQRAREKVAEAKTKVSATTDDVLGKTRDVSPGTATGAATQASQKARENRLPAAVVGAAMAGFLLGRWSKR
jgi:Protein of unknown function (DUF3618)